MKPIIIFSSLIIVSLSMCNSVEEDFTDNEIKTTSIERNKEVPLIKITTKNKIVDEPKRSAKLEILRNDSTIFSSNIGIELRGALSLNQPKKNFGFELTKADSSFAASLLGLPADSDWILLGTMTDKSMLRNALSYTLSRQMGRYAARHKFVELDFNGSFQGTYILMEKLKKGENKINITKNSDLKNPDTGYILKIDKTAGSGSGDWSDYNNKNSFPSALNAFGEASKKSRVFYLYEFPKAKNITENQKVFIQKSVHEFELSVSKSSDYGKFIDIDSFVDYLILAEFMQNHDAYRISTYLQKEQNGKIAMGPIWDCDIAYGPDFAFCSELGGDNWVFRYNQYCGNDGWLVPFWWEKLMSEKRFKAKVQARWQVLRKTVLSDKNVERTLQTMADEIQSSGMIERNYEKWSKSKTNGTFKARHQKHVDHIIDWSKKHSAWIDKEVLKL